MISKVVAILTVATLALGLLGTVLGTVVHLTADVKAKQLHEDADRVERDRDRNHIRQLERIIVAEFPKWSPAIDWDAK